MDAFLLAGGEVDGQQLVSDRGNFAEMFRPQFVTPPNLPGRVARRLALLTYGLDWFRLQDYRGMFVAMHTGSY